MKLSIHGAEFHYDPAGRCGFSNINLSLENGEIMCLLGPNGCGKTTLLKGISNLIKLKRGTVFLDSRDISRMKRAEIARIIGYVPQVHQPAFPFTVLDVVLLGRASHLSLLSAPKPDDVRIAENALETMGIAYLENKPYTEISGGERQMVIFARVVAQQPELLLLDEPTCHLDFGNQVRLLHVVEKLATTGLPIIMTSHFPDHVFMVANKVAIMKQGAIIDCGQPDDIITEANLHKVYDIPVSIRYVDGPVNRKICIPVTKNN
jgi:iron complex transport system ATP-binding protein